MSNFEMVSVMNSAFGNPKGDPANIDWERVRNQTKNIIDEFGETMIALGADRQRIQAAIANFKANIVFNPLNAIDVDGVRDGLCDIHVFAYGSHHFMGIDADRDMHTVVQGVMTRFVKDEHDLEETKAKFAAKGVTETYTEGSYPTMILKSAVDQPDAPKGKFLKAASYKEPIFYNYLQAGSYHFRETGE